MPTFIRLDPFHARSVRQEHTVEAFIASLEEQFPRIDDVWRALEWMLARAPERGEPVGDYFLMKSPDWEIEAIPQLTALYTFDDNQVNVYAVRDATQDEPEDQT